MTLIPARTVLRSQRPRFWQKPGASVQELVRRLALWHRRARTRRHLDGLPEHLLADVGLGVAESRRESARPFWRG